MKNIFVLPTEQKTRLFENVDGDLSLCQELSPNGIMCQNLNIYITNSEKPKVGDWTLNIEENIIFKPSYAEVFDIENSETKYYEYCKKIILTTDTDLIKNGVQAIDDNFLEWFVKNSSCEFVEVEDNVVANANINHGYPFRYKPIIPQEPKQDFPKLGTKEWNDLARDYFGGKPKQETIEEVVKTKTRSELFNSIYYFTKQIPRKEVETDAMDATSCAYEIEQLFYKHQTEKMFSEEEVKFQVNKLLNDLLYKQGFSTNVIGGIVNEWFNKFKKQ